MFNPYRQWRTLQTRFSSPVFLSLLFIMLVDFDCRKVKHLFLIMFFEWVWKLKHPKSINWDIFSTDMKGKKRLKYEEVHLYLVQWTLWTDRGTLRAVCSGHTQGCYKLVFIRLNNNLCLIVLQKYDTICAQRELK